MRPKQRIRKIYTEPDSSERSSTLDQNLPKTTNLNIKDLELNFSQGKFINEQRNSKGFIYKNIQFYMPNKFNKINRKQLIKKLPDINLTSLNTISKPMRLAPLEDIKPQERFSVSNKKNTFLLNSIFEILKPESSDQSQKEISQLKEKALKLGQKKNISIDSFYDNQFINVTNSSTKNRGPKIIENQITRLSNHNNIIRRKIVSQEKSRPKYQDKSIDKLKETTFQHFKRCVQGRDVQKQLVNSYENQPKQNFQNLEIITFYNKFPNIKRKQQERTEKLTKNKFIQQLKYEKQIKQSFTPLKAQLKAQQLQYQEDNEFIFEKN